MLLIALSIIVLQAVLYYHNKRELKACKKALQDQTEINAELYRNNLKLFALKN